MQPQAYNDIYNQLGAVYNPKAQALLDEQAAAETNTTTQLSSLDQAKVNAFKDIDLSANRKGLLFSGFSPNEQASYIGTKYLPAVANLKAALENTRTKIKSAYANLDTERHAETGKTLYAQQKDAADMAYKQAQLDLGYARIGAANSRSASSAANKPLTQTQVVAAIRGGLESVKGRDGHVAPQDLKMAYKDWTGAGYDPNAFWKYYQGYWNPNQGNYKQIFNSA